MKHVNLVPCGGWRMRSVGPGLVALALAAMAVAAPVHAADLPVAPAYNPPVPIPPAIYNWTGFYLGGNVGAGLLSENMTPTDPAAAFTPGVPLHPSIVGLVGGAQAGFDYQFSSIVVGAQASLSDSYLNGQNTQNNTDGLTQERMTSEPTWFASVTGRVGVAANTLLFYVKGGGAWMHIEHVQDILTGGATTATQSISDNRSGFVAGVGLEYAMTENLSALFEYDFYDFGTQTENFINTPLAIRSDLHTLVLGLNYRFNWGSVGEPFCPTC
jgi:outer membrane immunogenic protein